ncbi:glucuronate isomerase [Lignipirellula cremea]|uniref:Glucuronate isomerase n=1 Tax=Lignipirellula cremea TaxID=2528010 RepID=A0A518DUE3_9BACT|nr:glucuronate isomerase [Lignipirellula cremea]QDU95448.1 glucuronate isomerase [Lignipirellula cremea]
MSLELRNRLFNELNSLTLIDPHTHINPHAPASTTLADILGYHYYTELAHSAGMPKSEIEQQDLDPRELVGRLFENLEPLANTIQYSWFVEIAQAFFGLEGDELKSGDWSTLYETALAKMAADDWADQVLAQSKLEAVFLTNSFDDDLEGFDSDVYIPCLRTDDLVFQLGEESVRERLANTTGIEVHDVATLDEAIGKLFEKFISRGVRACAISLPPDFSPKKITPGRANTAIDEVCTKGAGANVQQHRAAAQFIFWKIAEYCKECRLPFDLMIGVNRNVYTDGVHQGRDLYDSRVSLIQYRELFNAFPEVKFPISVLASVTNQELASYAWIFPNVLTNGHWWYSNTPTFIEHDASARLEAVPATKQIGYYSDMYKLEFALPKFNMYKRILAKILSERYVIDRNWTEERALALGRQVLRGNVDATFPDRKPPKIDSAIYNDPALSDKSSQQEPEAGGSSIF